MVMDGWCIYKRRKIRWGAFVACLSEYVFFYLFFYFFFGKKEPLGRFRFSFINEITETCQLRKSFSSLNWLQITNH